MPADPGWLRSVVRAGVTPVTLLAVTVWRVVFLWRMRPPLRRPEADECDFGWVRTRAKPHSPA
jgi:hypothetical protein